MNNKIHRHSQSGFTILETMIALIVMISALSLGGMYMKSSADNQVAHTSSQNLQQLTQAAKAYVRDNYTQLNDGSQAEITLQEMVNEKYLSDNFPKKNSFQQTYKIVISPESNTDNMLRLSVITEGGERIALAQMRKIAGLAGGDVGYSSKENVIIGNQEGWSVNSEKIEQGHLASVNYISGKDVISAGTFLRRDKFDEHPEWNQMNTDLDMQKNAITAENDNDKASLSPHELVFDNGELVASLGADKGLLIKSAKNQISVSADTIQFDGSDNATTLTSNWIKPAVIVSSGSDIQGIYRDADNHCGNDVSSYGQIFSVRSSYLNDVTYTFSCGKKDKYSLTGGRAYLLSVSGDGEDYSMPAGNNCDTWDPIKDSGVDFCVKSLAKDHRMYLVKSLKWVKRIEAVHVWSGKKCIDKSHGSERSELCRVTAKEFYSYDKKNYEEMKNFIHPDKRCTESAIGSESGDRQNIFVIPEGYHDDALNYGSCDNLKYHDWQ